MTNIAVEVEHSFMTFLAQSGLQDRNMYQREEEGKVWVSLTSAALLKDFPQAEQEKLSSPV